MRIIGRKECEWNKNWRVCITMSDGRSWVIGEQMIRPTAHELYKKTLKEYNKTLPTMELEIDEKKNSEALITVIKQHIIEILLDQP